MLTIAKYQLTKQVYILQSFILKTNSDASFHITTINNFRYK